VIAIRAIRPWRQVRMTALDSKRVGHFIADASVLLAEIETRDDESRATDLFWFGRPTSNEQWARMVERSFRVHWWVRYLAGYNARIPGGEAHTLPIPTSNPHREVYRALERTPVRFEMSVEEQEAAKGWMRARGWQGEPIVCLLVRDADYLTKDPLHAAGKPGAWDYHNYRDSDISSYVDAVLEMVNRGYWVVRMGKTMRERLPLNHPHVIDFPFAADRTDLMDVWLSVTCRLFVSTATGIDIAPTIYGKPVTFVNALPLAQLMSSVPHLWVPKNLRWRETGRPLTLREHLNHPYTRTVDYDDAGIMIEDLSPAEIAAAIRESDDRLQGTWVDSEDDRPRQERFWTVLGEWRDFNLYHGRIHPEARVGSEWLKSLGDAFLE
jgi:putative glycosyltransferase (TIGR04372 family)